MRRQISEDGHATCVDDRYTVDVLYGPTRVCGLVKHRPGRVAHVKERLEKLCFNVNLRRFPDFGMVAFAFQGHVVFACAAKNLSFEGCSTDDPLVNKVIRIMEAERTHASVGYATPKTRGTLGTSTSDEKKCR